MSLPRKSVFQHLSNRPQDVVLLKTNCLGAGGFGAVCKAKLGHLYCAAKILHPLLFSFKEHSSEGSTASSKQPLRRFEQECEFLSSFQHPHIIQYLGTHQDPDTNAPVLLMELMDESLTDFLENSPIDIPYHLQVSITYHVALALSYLHNDKQIIHRDLSSNNILLLAGRHAKVTDFGMSKIFNAASKERSVAAMTVAPGTMVYMPPEAFEDNPIYTEKLDCFSLGVLIVQILTRQFPDPSERFTTMEVDYPSGKSVTRKVQAKVAVPEIERRAGHISTIDASLDLLKVALECLRDKDSERPSANDVCLKMEGLRESSEFKASLEQGSKRDFAPFQVAETERKLEECVKANQSQLMKVENELQEKKQEIEELKSMLELQAKRMREESDSIIASIMSDKDQLIQQRDRMIREKDIAITAQKTVLLRLEGQNKRMSGIVTRLMGSLEESNRLVHDREKTIEELHKKMARPTPKELLDSSRTQSVGHRFRTHSFSLVSTSAREALRAPTPMHAGSSAVIGSTVYFASAGSSTILAYDTLAKVWNKLPKCPVSGFTIASVEGSLTAIGGTDSSKIHTLVEDDGEMEWVTSVPPLQKPRANSIVISTESDLIVAGGESSNGRLSSIEVFNFATRKWLFTLPLPFPMSSASAAVCGGQIYFVGGFNENGVPQTTVIACSLGKLVNSAKLNLSTTILNDNDGIDSSTESLSDLSSKRSSIRWSRLSDLPVHSGTCTTFKLKLIIIGGVSTRDEAPTPMIYGYSYHPSLNTWEVIGDIPTARSHCLVAVVSDHFSSKLVVAGGLIGVTPTDEVDIITDVI